MIAMPAPLAFDFHLVATATAVVSALVYPLALRLAWQHRSRRHGIHSTGTGEASLSSGLHHVPRRKIASFYCGLVISFLAVSWPLGDLARKYSLLAYLVSNSILILAGTPLVLTSFPKWFYAEITRGRRTDAFLRHITRPLPSTIVFSAAVIFSMIPAVVQVATANTVAWDLLHFGVVAAATLMWITALNLLPGLRGLSAFGRVAFLFVQSLLPTFPAIVLIFARHSMYHPYLLHARQLGIAPVTDQELAGGVVKVISIVVFWSVAAVILARASRDEELGIDPQELTWDDVEREFQRSNPRENFSSQQ